MTHLVARISNRAMVGLPLCRNRRYIHAIVHFAELVFPYAQLLRRVPRFARGLVIRLFNRGCAEFAWCLQGGLLGGLKCRRRKARATEIPCTIPQGAPT